LSELCCLEPSSLNRPHPPRTLVTIRRCRLIAAIHDENVGPLSRTTDLLESRAPLRDGAGCPKNDMPAKVDVGNILVLA
jgi:hypothetical protein